MDTFDVNNDVGAGFEAAAVRASAAAMDFLNAFAATVPYDHYGRDPHDVYPPHDGWREFKPEYIAILYIKMVDGWEISLNHACFAMEPGSSEQARRDKAVEILKEKIATGVELGDPSLLRFGPYKHRLAGAHHQVGRDFDSTYFADFNFASQNELFIYLDDPDIQLTPGGLLTFKPFGKGPLPKSPNYSYFHAREVPEAEMDGLTGKMIRVENHVTKEDGTAIEADENRWYSMDIRFQVDAGSEGLITILIDPDTGNGGGNEP